MSGPLTGHFDSPCEECDAGHCSYYECEYFIYRTDDEVHTGSVASDFEEDDVVENALFAKSDEVITKLWEKDPAMKIQLYKSYSTNSVYLKFDFGVANSLRISDHDGKQGLNYKFNLLLNNDKPRVSVNHYNRYYFGRSEIDDLVKMIISEKDARLERYTERNYKRYMDNNRLDNVNSSGFWKQCVVLNESTFKGVEHEKQQ